MENSGFIYSLLSQFANAEASAVAFSVYDGQKVTDITYQQFLSDILRAAGFFQKKGIQKQHIALMGATDYDMFVALMGVWASGNVAVLMNASLPLDLLQWQCEKTDVSLIYGDDLADEVKPAIENTVWISRGQIKSGSPLVLQDLTFAEQDQTALILFTSGTTGKSKAAELTAGNLLNAVSCMEGPFVQSSMRCYNGFPLFHLVTVLTVGATLLHGNTVCLGRGIQYMFLDFSKLNPSVAAMVPASADSLAKLLKKAGTEQAREKYTGFALKRICIHGAATKTATTRQLMEAGLTVETAYGMTEIGGHATWGELKENHIGSSGKACRNIQCRIQDGEILIKGPSVMKGYYKDPKATEEVLVDGWMHTGDLGYFDEDGYLYITGRKKNVIILSNGENVNPEEIEAKFGECKEILECMVYSDGKGICADVYTQDQDQAADFIRAYNESMPMYRQVYKVHYSNQPLEKTGTGKIKRKENVYV